MLHEEIVYPKVMFWVVYIYCMPPPTRFWIVSWCN